MLTEIKKENKEPEIRSVCVRIVFHGLDIIGCSIVSAKVEEICRHARKY
jgi:hypothetical protein